MWHRLVAIVIVGSAFSAIGTQVGSAVEPASVSRPLATKLNALCAAQNQSELNLWTGPADPIYGTQGGPAGGTVGAYLAAEQPVYQAEQTFRDRLLALSARGQDGSRLKVLLQAENAALAARGHFLTGVLAKYDPATTMDLNVGPAPIVSEYSTLLTAQLTRARAFLNAGSAECAAPTLTDSNGPGDSEATAATLSERITSACSSVHVQYVFQKMGPPSPGSVTIKVGTVVDGNGQPYTGSAGPLPFTPGPNDAVFVHNSSYVISSITCFGPIPINACGQRNSITSPNVPFSVPAQAGLTISAASVASFGGPRNVDVGAYKATIQWGDGSTSAGTVNAFTPFGVRLGCQVVGRHRYQDPGHYQTIVRVTGGSQSAIVTSAVVAVSPPIAASGSVPTAVGVLTSQSGPQCTGTVINLDNSDSVYPPVISELVELKKQFAGSFNHDVVVTAAHCVDGAQDLRFAPGFIGVAPRYSADFDSGTVSPSGPSDPYGSPFQGQSIGVALHGVWKADSNNVFVSPKYNHGSDPTYDWAFIAFTHAPDGMSGNLQDAASGGISVLFAPDRVLGRGTKVRHSGYDIDWADAPPRGYAPNGKIKAYPDQRGCIDGLNTHQFDCTSPYLRTAGGPRTCNSLSVTGSVQVPGASKKVLAAAPCNLGNFSSGAPFFIGAHGNLLIGVNKVTINTPGTVRCCTSLITVLEEPAIQDALDAARA